MLLDAVPGWRNAPHNNQLQGGKGPWNNLASSWRLLLLWPPWKSPVTLDEMVVETERGEGWISNLLFVFICGIIDLS